VSLTTSGDATVRIETPFTLVAADVAHTIDPEVAAPFAADVLGLFQHDITDATTTEDGTLTLGFDHGAGLVVEPDAGYEAWTVTGRHGLRFVCLAGGGLAIWDADRSLP
jgi:hypothetical protein